MNLQKPLAKVFIVFRVKLFEQAKIDLVELIGILKTFFLMEVLGLLVFVLILLFY